MEQKSLKSWCYRWLVKSRFGALINHKLLALIATSLVGGVPIYLDVFGGQDTWVQNHIEQLRTGVVVVLDLAFVVRLLRMVGEWSAGSTIESGSTILELFISVGRIVEQKIGRFRSVAKTFSGTQAFQKLTMPDLQIEIILKEANDYFCRQHLLEEHQLDATVLHLSPTAKSWDFVFRSNPNRNGTSAKVLMTENSAALYAHTSGQPCFFPSKFKARDLHRYRKSANDDSDGSIYCYPVRVTTPAGDMLFVVTFATYGKCLCDDINETTKNAFGLIFREFSRRIELELILWTIKGFKKPPRTANLKTPRRPKK